MSDILFSREGEWGVVVLNRPEALNALNWGMARAMRAQLIRWMGDPEVRAVLVKAAGEKAFCAGGDIRWLHDEGRRDPRHVCGFFHEEYRLNAAIHHFEKPYVALIDGVVMGGGVGLSVHGDFRVVGDRTLFAMPETGIGLFPDVGGGHFLPRLHDGLGLYYALTGARAKAADCMAAGIATHYVPSEKRAALERDLLALSFGGHPHADIEAALDAHVGDPGAAPINDSRGWIRDLFLGHDRLESLVDHLNAVNSVFAIETAKTLARMSPTSMKITFEQLKRGALLGMDDVMRMEYRIVRRVMEGHDFYEGVRATLIDKDKSPKWRPAALAAVNDDDVAPYFAPLPSNEELELP
ncbi:MAG: enoyl-CoA hydratase/isomerase family protein [Parvularculaceae bacterium]|nr:enoyl-CoA hydratase/isomerase family protein [Parvularculaceae bacterium]